MSFFLAFKLRRAKNTEKIEAQEALLEKEYNDFISYPKSQEYINYLKLGEEINTPSFIEKKKAKDYKNSEEANIETTYNKIKNSSELKKYLSLVKKNNFEEFEKWELTFSEEFEKDKLDRNKWLTKYYWGDKLIKDSYALKGEEHYFTDGKNINIAKSIAKLTCKSENIKGKVWDPALGFNFKDFKYSSALISTAKSFRQKYGKFQAKIKTDNIIEIENSFWMVSEKMTPHIDVLKTTKKSKLLPASFCTNKGSNKSSISKVKGVKLNTGFYIFTLEWYENKIIWKVNNVVIKTQTKDIPQEEMYMVFSLAVANATKQLNANMEIDWVRCYKRK